MLYDDLIFRRREPDEDGNVEHQMHGDVTAIVVVSWTGEATVYPAAEWEIVPGIGRTVDGPRT